MSKINKLSSETIAKISAGEVVVGPANVVKELIENSVDAGAKTIKIFVHNGGLKEITVIDDGSGMSKNDLVECFKRHTTSKITDIEDLDRLDSFGFRGEALFSIASVSRLSISSREQSCIEGYYVDLEGTEVVSSGMLGMPVGTKVQVCDLFYNVPARKKFLKSISEELRAVSSVVTKMCLAHPDISFRFYHNQTELINVSSDNDVEDRIKNLFSDEHFHSMIRVVGNYSIYNLFGYVSAPQDFRSAKSKQHLFVNKRQISDNSLSEAVRAAYGEVGDVKKYPQFILFLDMPPHTLDVNIHPQKERVHFLDSESVYNFVKSSVSAALEASDLTHAKRGYKGVNDYVGGTENLLKEYNEEVSGSILQVHNLYLIQEVDDGIEIIDQHAAHERVIYERMIGAIEKSMDDYLTETLEMPYSVNLDTSDLLVLESAKALLAKIGITYVVDDGVCYVQTVPIFMKDRNIQVILKEFIDDITLTGKITDLDSNTKKALSHMACKLAIKDGYPLKDFERYSLVKQLDKSDIPYVCPHGRPAKVFIPNNEIANWFKR